MGKFAELIVDPKNDMIVSVVSFWEISIKKALGKLKLPNDWYKAVDKSGFTWLNLELKHIQHLDTLPLIHNDPFDRLLISQAYAEQFKLITCDKIILQYAECRNSNSAFLSPSQCPSPSSE